MQDLTKTPFWSRGKSPQHLNAILQLVINVEARTASPEPNAEMK